MKSQNEVGGKCRLCNFLIADDEEGVKMPSCILQYMFNIMHNVHAGQLYTLVLVHEQGKLVIIIIILNVHV